MFTTLLESRHVPQRRTGGSIASIVVHSVIVTAAVVGTARHTIPTTRLPEQVELVFIPNVAPPPPSRAVATANVLPSPATPGMFQHIVVPTAIPTSIPAVDFTAIPTTSDFVAAGPVGRPGVVCTSDTCTDRPVMDGERVLWTSSDFTMQLKDQVTPRYPESLRRAAVEGDVVAKFLVDTTGRIDPRSVEILSTTHEAFSDAVRDALGRMRFAPSMIGARKVQALAIMPFRFRLR